MSYNNPLNSNEPIRKSRDTQEIPPDMGKEIALMFEIPKIIEDPAKIVEEESESSEDFFDVKKTKENWGKGGGQNKPATLGDVNRAMAAGLGSNMVSGGQG